MAEEKKEDKETKEPRDSEQPKDNKGMPEWLAPIVSALGSMGGSYMIWIKPLQERMDKLTDQVNDIKAEVKELRQQNKEYEKELENVNLQLENNLSGEHYLPIKQSNGQGSFSKKRFKTSI